MHHNEPLFWNNIVWRWHEWQTRHRMPHLLDHIEALYTNGHIDFDWWRTPFNKRGPYHI